MKTAPLVPISTQSFALLSHFHSSPAKPYAIRFYITSDEVNGYRSLRPHWQTW